MDGRPWHVWRGDGARVLGMDRGQPHRRPPGGDWVARSGGDDRAAVFEPKQVVPAAPWPAGRDRAELAGPEAARPRLLDGGVHGGEVFRQPLVAPLHPAPEVGVAPVLL